MLRFSGGEGVGDDDVTLGLEMVEAFVRARCEPGNVGVDRRELLVAHRRQPTSASWYSSSSGTGGS